MGLSTYAGNKVLEHIISFADWPEPANTFFSLHTGDPGGTGAFEANYTGYTRLQATWNSATGAGGATNNGDHEFADVDSNITITHIGLWDASSGGNFLFSFNIADTLIETGKVPKIADQAITINPGTAYSNTNLAGQITNHLIGVAGFNYDPNVWLGLYDGDPFDIGDPGTELDGVGSNYVRVNIKITTPTAGSASNIADEVFATAGKDLGDATHWAIHVSPSGGIILAGALTNPASIKEGDDYLFLAGDLIFTT